LRRQVGELCDRVGLPLDRETAGRLGVGLKQRLEIVKALATDARMLLLDEPTAVLAPGEVAELFRVVRRFTDAGAAVLITHKLAEARGGRSVTVLRRGAVVSAGRPGLRPCSAGAAMLGEVSGPRRRPRRAVSRETAWSRLGRSMCPRGGTASRYGASFEVRAGRSPVSRRSGNGQRELLRAVAGRLRPLRGRQWHTAGVHPGGPHHRGLIPELS
jgi:simple sugar transport system ATP-binding protein